jgi:lipopolysaccharide export system permease protein
LTTLSPDGGKAAMKLLTRYVLREVLQIFLLTLFSLTMFMMLVGVGAEAISHGLGPVHLLQLLPFMLPKALLFAIPGTVLLAASMVYGRMSNFGEIVAIKSMGISPMAVIWPTLFLATALSFVTVWLNDLAVSWGDNGIRSVAINAIEDIIYGVLRTQRNFSSKNFSVVVRRVDDRVLHGVTITFEAGAEAPRITITCDQAEFRSQPGSGVLTIICRTGDIDVDGNVLIFDEIVREIPLDEASGKSGGVSPAHMSLTEIPARIRQQQAAIERGKQMLAATAAYCMMTGDLADLGGAAWKSRSNSVKDLHTTLYKLQTEPPRRWANGFSCLCFALVGVPLAIRLRNADMLTSFFLCFGPILVVYYPLMLFGLDRSKAGALPPMTVWAANLLLALWGLWLLRRVIRY